jgi:hypothetical protein
MHRIVIGLNAEGNFTAVVYEVDTRGGEFAIAELRFPLGLPYHVVESYFTTLLKGKCVVTSVLGADSHKVEAPQIAGSIQVTPDRVCVFNFPKAKEAGFLVDETPAAVTYSPLLFLIFPIVLVVTGLLFLLAIR